MREDRNIIQSAAGNELLLRISRSWIRIPGHEVVLIESARNYIKIFTTTARLPYLVRCRLDDAERLLSARHFCRVHRSYIVSLYHVRCIDPDNVIDLGPKNVPLSKPYASMLYNRFILFGMRRFPLPPTHQLFTHQ